MARAATRAIVIWGDGLGHKQRARRPPEQNRGSPVHTVPYQNRINTVGAEPSKDVG